VQCETGRVRVVTHTTGVLTGQKITNG